jgi:hypothetical protein
MRKHDDGSAKRGRGLERGLDPRHPKHQLFNSDERCRFFSLRGRSTHWKGRGDAKDDVKRWTSP